MTKEEAYKLRFPHPMEQIALERMREEIWSDAWQAAIESQQQWIPVSERLPAVATEILVLTAKNLPDVAYWDGERWATKGGYYIEEAISYWTNILPKP